MYIEPISEEQLKDILSYWPAKEAFTQRIEEQSNDKIVFLIMWNEKRPIGHAKIIWDIIPIIEDMYIIEELQSMGLGSKLLENIFSKIKQRDYSECKLYVEEDNLRAVDFYLKNGFVLTGNLVDNQKELSKSFH